MVGVADATFSVGEGEIFCIMGLSGSGKSTLVRHINRLIEPTDGLVLFKGENVSALDTDQLRSLRSAKIAMVFQHMALLPHRNVRDNAAFALELRGVPEKGPGGSGGAGVADGGAGRLGEPLPRRASPAA